MDTNAAVVAENWQGEIKAVRQGRMTFDGLVEQARQELLTPCDDPSTGRPNPNYPLATPAEFEVAIGVLRMACADGAHHARTDDGRHEATQLRTGRWVSGRAYGECADCTSHGIAYSGHAVDGSVPTYATREEALAAAEADAAAERAGS